MVIFTTEVAIDDVWWHLTINEVTWVTLVQPCCTQKREQFECCRCRPRSASFKLFSLLSLFTFVTFPRLLSPISTLLDFSSETSNSFLITSLRLVFTTVHELTLWDLLLKSSLWNCKIEEGFRAFHRNVRSSFFVVAHFLTMRGVSSWDVAHSTPEILKMHKSSQFAAFNWFFSAASLSGSPVEMCSGNELRASVRSFSRVLRSWSSSAAKLFSQVQRNFSLVSRLQHVASVSLLCEPFPVGQIFF